MAISKSFKIFSLIAVAATFLLSVIGGVVRITGSGDACPDWPLCHGSIIPPFELHIWIEWTHRLSAGVASAAIAITVLWATLTYRREAIILRSAWLTVVLLVAQIILGALVVRYGLPPALVGIHLGNALLILGALVAVSVFAYRPWVVAPTLNHPTLRRNILLSLLGVYALIISGTVVVGLQATVACGAWPWGWPLCNAGVLPNDFSQVINLTHRYIAAGIGLFLIYTLRQTLRVARHVPLLRRTAHTVIGLFGLQVIGGGINALSNFNQFWNSLHLVLAVAVWCGMVAFAIIGWHVLSPATTEQATLSRAQSATAGGR
jgi:cytochrome c oxidase assembly protein subunit 15